MKDPAGDAFRAGDLPGAVAATIAAVKASPRDSGLRWLLAEMLLFSGEVEKADRALDAVIAEEPSPAVLEFRRLLRAEEHRRQVFRDGRIPKFQGDDPTPAQRAALRALTLTRSGDLAGAAEAAAEAEGLRPATPGQMDGKPFDDLRDVDDVFAPQFEVLTAGGDYMWVPVERLRSLVPDPVRRPRDLYWRRCMLELKDGTEGAVFLPAVYAWAGTPADAVKLGRETEWTQGEGPVRGIGLRLLLVGEEAVPLTELGALEFA
ncbi:tetratricopeptide repeat protein [Roseomonas sp. OT10]|uniref:type VI secretion system accessory protein TagJ n=1 Tax=Roseomonas cutis TaxID=2897332 RepID=UPI001E5A03D1|nr:type VI secretion system accessory protein TagJ [Roseomonas sp. OT10]UFN47571.1 tetratricopeptide repeat protein [Roseomonas sp. OT10]